MIENLTPWHTTGIPMVATLGVPIAQYWQWQFLSLINFVVAITLALTGIGCFYEKSHESAPKEAAVENH